MADTKVTYLIGAGASANALPVVNGMNERMKVFLNLLKDINKELENKFATEKELDNLTDLLDNIATHYTIDTYAKKLYLKEDNKNYGLLKRFLICYLLFEQVDKETNKNYKNELVISKVKSEIFSNKYKKFINVSELLDKIDLQLDSRYDSFFASLLNDKKTLDSNINIISWNYDLQFELSYTDFWSNKLPIYNIQKFLQVFPMQINQEIDFNKSAIIKINGIGNFISSNDNLVFDIINDNFYEDSFIEYLFKILFNSDNSLKSVYQFTNQLKFAWENDEQVTKAREYAQEIIGKSDVIVIIGYSFPTFNREVDREIFKLFNSNCLKRFANDKIEKYKKIYIQDMPENAPKIKERLKAIGNNLFDVAEIYDDVDQFLIPYEL